MSKYKVPDEFYFFPHHVRPRFKFDPESVLFYVSASLSSIGRKECYEHRNLMRRKLFEYPGNADKTLKTIDNWRTEITALFGYIRTDGKYERISRGNYYWPSKRALELFERQDLAEAFKIFLYNFQYPGAHVNATYCLEQIKAGVHFKPAQYFLKVLRYANREGGNSYGITKEEACHCIFTDLRVTRDGRSPADTWKLIEKNREDKVEYDSTGDVVRYAKDILDYLVLANLMTCYDGSTFRMNRLEEESIIRFCESTEWFDGYDEMIRTGNADIECVRSKASDWFDYVNREMSETDFSTDILAYISENEEELEALKKAAAETDELEAANSDIEGTIESKLERLSAKEIGDIGENLVYGHECMRLKLGGKENLIHLVKRIPTQLAVGYDILSCEIDAKKRFIEVKTTISSRPLEFNSFHLTPNEWNMADTVHDRYFVYRLALSKTGRKLVMIQDPVGKYKQDLISMVPSHSGVDMNFKPEIAGVTEDLLTWES